MADLAIDEIVEYHNDVVFSLRLYFNQCRAEASDFRSRDAITNKLNAHMQETDQRSAFFILASVEKAFRVDYELRCKKRLKDGLSRVFREIYKKQNERVRLDDIFKLWKAHPTASHQLIGELRSAFNFRHWVAHGRYGVPKFIKYDFNSVYDLANKALSGFPLEK